MVLSTLSIPQPCSSDHPGGKSSLHSRWTLPTKYEEKFQQRRKNPGRDHNLFPSSGSTRATPLRSKKFLARFAAPYYSGPNLGPWNCGNAFSARDLSFLEFLVPYESGTRRITSNLGSDLFCPLWLVGLAHLEWRARVARSSCIGRRWSVGCSPLVLDRSSWSVWTYSAHGEWHHDLVRKSVRRCCGASALIVCPGCGQRVLFVASTLVTSSVTTKVSNK